MLRICDLKQLQLSLGWEGIRLQSLRPGLWSANAFYSSSRSHTRANFHPMSIPISVQI